MYSNSILIAQGAACGLASDSARLASDIVKYAECRTPDYAAGVGYSIARMRNTLDQIERLIETEADSNV
jgi:hypothetical protein